MDVNEGTALSEVLRIGGELINAQPMYYSKRNDGRGVRQNRSDNERMDGNLASEAGGFAGRYGNISDTDNLQPEIPEPGSDRIRPARSYAMAGNTQLSIPAETKFQAAQRKVQDKFSRIADKLRSFAKGTADHLQNNGIISDEMRAA